MDATQPQCPKCGRPMQVSRFTCSACDVDLEGRFDLPPLARLSVREQVFVVAFVRCHGNIKRMEQVFGISYPTVKNRLNALTDKLDAPLQAPQRPGPVLDRLAAGEINVEQALDMLGQG